MAMGLASMNPIPGPRVGVVMVHDKSEDKDLGKGFGNFSVTNDFNSQDLLSLDDKGKAIFKKSQELDESPVSVYYVNTVGADRVFNSLIKEACMDYDDRPEHGPSYIYETFTGKQLLCEDQADYDPLLEKVYLDKLSKKVNGIVDSFDSEAKGIMNKGTTDIHYPLEERPLGAAASEEDGSVKFPMLAHTMIDPDKAEAIWESIITGKGEIDAEDI